MPTRTDAEVEPDELTFTSSQPTKVRKIIALVFDDFSGQLVYKESDYRFTVAKQTKSRTEENGWSKIPDRDPNNSKLVRKVINWLRQRQHRLKTDFRFKAATSPGGDTFLFFSIAELGNE